MQAAQEYAPNYICQYLHELAQRYNTFYNKHRILNPGGRKESSRDLGGLGITNLNGEQNSLGIQKAIDAQREFRLLMTQAVGQTLENGLRLLGIEAPRKM